VYGGLFAGDVAMSEAMTILCGRCHINVEPRVNPDGHTLLVCPKCGESDTAENAVREAGEYLIDKATRESLPGPDTPDITVTSPPERTYRFIMVAG
jgi:hypothetical protein